MMCLSLIHGEGRGLFETSGVNGHIGSNVENEVCGRDVLRPRPQNRPFDGSATRRKEQIRRRLAQESGEIFGDPERSLTEDGGHALAQHEQPAAGGSPGSPIAIET